MVQQFMPSRMRLMVLLLLCCSPCTAICSEVEDALIWFNYTTTGSLYKGQDKTKFRYWFDGQERFGDNYQRSSQWIVRPGLGYAVNKYTSLWFGTAYIDINYPYAQRPSSERGLWQQVLWVKQYPQLTLTSRTRLEQRFISTTAPANWRLRELIKVVSPLANHPDFSIIGSDELFWHHRNTLGNVNHGLNQNRFFMGIGYSIAPAATLEIGYLNQFIYRRGADNLLANIFSTTFIVNLT